MTDERERNGAADRTWSEAFLHAFGVSFGLRSEGSELAAALRAIAPPGATEVASPTPDHWITLWAEGEAEARIIVGLDGEQLAYRGPSLPEALAVLDARLRLHLASHSPDRVFVHAGVVRALGQTIVIPGRSFSGKSTLVAALLAEGASYLSDEYAVLDGEGLVHSFLRPLALRAHGERRATPDPRSLAAGADSATGPQRIALVLSTHYRAGASFAPEPISAGQAMLELFDNTVSAQIAPARAWTSLRAAVEGCRALRGERGEADQAARALIALLAAGA